MVAVGLVLRLVVASFDFGSVADPVDGHGNFGWELGWTARSVALGHGFSSPFVPFTGPTALVPPLFTYLLAGIFKLFGLYTREAAFATLALDSIFSALTCIPLYLSTRHSLGPKAARWAGWAWVVYPYAVYFSAGIVWEFALTGLLFALCFWRAQTLDRRLSLRNWIGFGLLCGITALSNPSTLPVTGLLLLLAAWRAGRWSIASWMRAAVGALALASVLAPWTVRNYKVMHILCPMRDGFWLEFWAGNAGDSSESNPAWAHPASNPVEMQRYQQLGETAYMESKHAMAVNFVSNHPRWFVAVTGRRIFRYWTGFWSFSRSYLHGQPLDVPNFFFCSVLTGGMLFGAFRWLQWARWERSSRHLLAPYLIALIVFPLPYYVTHASMDYRQPIESVILVMVVAGFALRPERPVLEALSLDREPEYEDVLVEEEEEEEVPVPSYVSAGWDAGG
jgi:4-amino-4-deoxy-L-arabinose transferase-like glycosyltransferase